MYKIEELETCVGVEGFSCVATSIVTLRCCHTLIVKNMNNNDVERNKNVGENWLGCGKLT